MQNLQPAPWAPLMLVGLVASLAGCGALSEVTVGALNSALPGTLAGAQGAKADDQDRIDDMVAALCKGEIYDENKCALHTQRSADRFEALQ